VNTNHTSSCTRVVLDVKCCRLFLSVTVTPYVWFHLCFAHCTCHDSSFRFLLTAHWS